MRHLHFALMPNPHSPGYHAHTEHGRLHLSAPHLSFLPQPFRAHRISVQCLPACHLTFPGQLVTTSSDVAPSCSQQLRCQGREAQGGSWLAERRLPLLSSHPMVGAEQEQSMGCPLHSSILTETWHSLELQSMVSIRVVG